MILNLNESNSNEMTKLRSNEKSEDSDRGVSTNKITNPEDDSKMLTIGLNDASVSLCATGSPSSALNGSREETIKEVCDSQVESSETNEPKSASTSQNVKEKPTSMSSSELFKCDKKDSTDTSTQAKSIKKHKSFKRFLKRVDLSSSLNMSNESSRINDFAISVDNEKSSNAESDGGQQLNMSTPNSKEVKLDEDTHGDWYPEIPFENVSILFFFL